MSAFENASADDADQQLAEARRLRDLALIEAYRSGDDSAASTLFEAYRKDALIAAIDAAPDHDTAEDFVAEAFARIFEMIQQGKGPSENFRYYLRATIRTISLDWYRAQRGNVSVGDLEPFEPLIAEQTGGQREHEPEAALEAGEGSEIVSAFQRLPERWRRIIFLKVVEGQSTAESAAELGVNMGTAGVLYQRARDGLRKEYLTEVATARSVGGDLECQEIAGDLAASIGGRVPRSRQNRLNSHLAHCMKCTGSRGELATLAARFNKKTIAPALAGVAGSLILPSLNTGSRAAAATIGEALRGATWLHFGLVGLAGAAVIATAVVMVVNGVNTGETGGGSGSESIVIESGVEADSADRADSSTTSTTAEKIGACTLAFAPSTKGTTLATLTTSNTGTNTCTLRAWIDGEEIVAPFAITTSQVTVLSRPGELRVELSAGGKSETRTFTVAGR